MEYFDREDSIDKLNLTVRSSNVLRRIGIHTIGALIDFPEEKFIAQKNIGRKSSDEILAICQIIRRTIGDGGEDCSSMATATHKRSNFLPAILNAHITDIVNGDFSFADTEKVTAYEIGILNRYRIAQKDLGSVLAHQCITSPEIINSIVNMLSDFGTQTKQIARLQQLVQFIPSYRHAHCASLYIRAYTLNENTRARLTSFYTTKEASLISIVNVDLLEVVADQILVDKFLKWCAFDTKDLIDNLLLSTFKDSRSETVIQLRATKNTLQEIGEQFKITKERVRQIERKAFIRFSKSQSKIRLLSKISTDRDGDMVITPSEIREYAGDKTEALLYLLKNTTSRDYLYDDKLDVFVIGDDSLSERVLMYIEQLPPLIQLNEIPSILEEAEETDSIPAEILEKGIKESYSLTGEVYHRIGLNREVVYSSILREFYPEGIHAYDAEELKPFRKHIAMRYGDINVPVNDRALSAGIGVVSILCGRGRYKAKEAQYLPAELSNKIYKYIETNETPILMTNTVFSIFEDELSLVGVDNKYYLQGILHELYATKLTFKRDYISRDAFSFTTSIYSSLVGYIEKSSHPVSKKDLQENFPGITDIVLNFAISDQPILNYFGVYWHGKHVKVSAQEISELRTIITSILADGAAHHIEEILDAINVVMPFIFSRNFALFPYAAFSLLEHLFRKDFQFERPYIAEIGINIGRPRERLHEMIYESDEFALNDIREFNKENKLVIQSILGYVNSCNDAFLLQDNTKMVSIDKTGITVDMVLQLEQEILKEIDSTIPIAQLRCIANLPRINVPWTEWLIYGALNKWAKSVSVMPSANQLRLAIPLVAPLGQLDRTAFEQVSSADYAPVVTPDNLDDIDSLLLDMDDIDFLEDVL